MRGLPLIVLALLYKRARSAIPPKHESQKPGQPTSRQHNWARDIDVDDDARKEFPAREIPIDQGQQTQKIPLYEPGSLAVPPRAGIWKRVAPDPKGRYKLEPGPWYCICLDWPVVDRAPTVEEITKAFRADWHALLAWDDPDQQSLLPNGKRGGHTLSTNVPITRELALGRVWLMGVCKPNAPPLMHTRVVECWRRYASDVTG